jgi:2'-deoxynucleoside 5'-phosphate N-hydrolase
MKIYFSCSLTGGRQDQPMYAALVKHLVARGQDVLTAHLAAPEVMEEEAVVDPLAVYRRDIAWVEACDVMIAEVSTPSHGVGYEIAYALDRHTPVLCCYRAGARVSKMLLGNTSADITVTAYADEADAVKILDSFIRLHLRPKA